MDIRVLFSQNNYHAIYLSLESSDFCKTLAELSFSFLFIHMQIKLIILKLHAKQEKCISGTHANKENSEAGTHTKKANNKPGTYGVNVK